MRIRFRVFRYHRHGQWNLDQEGTGNLVLFGNNTFTGDVFVNAGRLEVYSGAAASQ
ncbi:autotransporter-associated beta strand repeat-containing protein [Roseicyclus sp.]|uniref:autotransporter-associated beta strand repeat-containing protein n=1 Tax=Roseicyclus sp. TaxID=1914329 RepID=UPI001BCF8CBF